MENAGAFAAPKLGNGCKYCKPTYGADFDIKPCGNGDMRIQAQIHRTENDTPGIVIMQNNFAMGHFEVKYCPICGKKLEATQKMEYEGDGRGRAIFRHDARSRLR